MGVLGRLFGGSSGGSGPTMTSAAGGVLPASPSEEGGGGAWRSLGPMPTTIARFSPMVQTARFESSLTTRSRPTSLAPLVHDRSAQYLSGVVEGIAVAFPAPPATGPPADPSSRPPMPPGSALCSGSPAVGTGSSAPEPGRPPKTRSPTRPPVLWKAWACRGQ